MAQLRLVRLLGRHRWILGVLAGLGVLVAGTWAAQALVTARIFGALLDGGLGDDVFAGLASYLLALAGLLLLRPLLVMVREVVATTLMTRAKIDLRDRLAVRLVAENARDAGRGRTGHDHAVLVDGVENLDPYLSRYLPQLAVTGLVFLGVATIMVTIDPVTAAAVVCGALLLTLLPRLWDRALARRGADHWDAYQELHAEFVDSMQGMTTLVTFGAAQRRQDELAAASQRLLARTLRQLRISLLESGLNGFALAAIPLVALMTVWARSGSLTSYAAFALVLLSIELVRPLRDLAGMWHAGYLGTFSGREVAAVLAGEREYGRAPVVPSPAWRLAEVSFTHAGAADPALRQVDLTIESGTTGIVGPSGGGKSTLAGLLAGLHRPTSGALHGPGDPREMVALVPQDPILFSGTVRENIALAAGAAGPTLEAAAIAAGIGTDDTTLTLDTTVGERGLLVSGGQRQRVAIARALAQGRPLLVLDESTSALDARSERLVLARIRTLRAGAPMVVIAHRPGAVAGADRLVTVAGGRIAAVAEERAG